ncbi:unnamed protein product [Mesocestoides corti]|uniref:Uncharacterized protein n=2 Tax=Mesocestoides corti TaxID=53468 RepID=A0A0R3UJM8_MESCO|nr:unnamed protein product [Mesocestoides corti]
MPPKKSSSSSSSKKPTANRLILPKVNLDVSDRTHEFVMPRSSAKRKSQKPTDSPHAVQLTPTTAVNQHIPTVAEHSASSSTETQPIHSLTTLTYALLPSLPASTPQRSQQASQCLSASSLHPTASESKALLVNALKHAKTATMIAQMATVLAGTMNSIAQAFASNESTDTVSSGLGDGVQQLSTIKFLSGILDDSLSKMLPVYKNSCSITSEPPLQVETDSSSATTPPAKSSQESTEEEPKPPRSKSPPQGDTDEEHIPLRGKSKSTYTN